ncbi:toxin-antitoxin system TumE family protein [Sphingomonas sp.]|uniref:toxin-antitoxin system TumE family protein n=1 Tax=Sphingomonas sp. TaxID=28214 RepID=UPI002EDB2DB5
MHEIGGRLAGRNGGSAAALGQLTTATAVVIEANVKADLLLDERHQIAPTSFVRLRVWRVPVPVRGSVHDLKYSLAYIVGGECVLRYDNEAGKGDHRHLGLSESDYAFTTPDRLLADFWHDVDQWRSK